MTIKAHFSTLCQWLTHHWRFESTTDPRAIHNLVCSISAAQWWTTWSTAARQRYFIRLIYNPFLDFVSVCKLNQTTCTSKWTLQRCTNVVHVISLLCIDPKHCVCVHVCILSLAICLQYLKALWFYFIINKNRLLIISSKCYRKAEFTHQSNLL